MGDRLTQLREDTPGVRNRIHFNNAGAGLMPRPVVDAVQEHTALEAEIGGYEAADARADAIGDFYVAAGELLGTPAENIAFAPSATDAYSRALSSVPFEPGDVVLTTRDDYVSNQIAFLSLSKRFGIDVVHAPNLPGGGVDMEALGALARSKRPRLVAVTHIPTNSGLVQPVAKIGALCRELDLLYLLDACQSAGQLPLDISELGCDFLSATGRKFLRGPRGSGFLFVSGRALDAGLEPLFIDMRGADWTGLAPTLRLRRPHASRTGSSPTRRSSARPRRSATRSRSGWTRSGSARRRSGLTSAQSSRRSKESSCSTAARSSAP